MRRKRSGNRRRDRFSRLFHKKNKGMAGYFFKVETIDWQSRRFRYIVNDTAIFSKKYPSDSAKTHAPACSAGVESFFLEGSEL